MTRQRGTKVDGDRRGLAALFRLDSGPGALLERRQNRLGMVFVLPTVVLLGVAILYPLIYGVTLGFSVVNVFSRETRWVGLDNFKELLSPDGQFFHALVTGLIWSVGTVATQVVLGVGIALVLNQPFFGRTFVRSMLIFPYLVPAIVAVLVWKWMFNDIYGITNSVLIDIGIIDKPILWLSDPNWAMVSVILVGAWRTFPFVLITVLGRLQTIPEQLYDAAKVDGASNLRMFFTITLPQLRGVLLVSVLLRFIWDFNEFNTIALLTNGGPGSSTETLPLLIYQFAFVEQKPGMAAATGDLALVALLLILGVFYLVTRRRGRNAEA